MLPKLVTVGNQFLDTSQLSTFTSGLYELIPVPTEYPPSCLEYLGEIALVLINLSHDDFSLVQKWNRHCKHPIIVLIGAVNAVAIQKAFRNGASDVITSPIDGDELLNVLQRLLQIRPQKEESTEKQKSKLANLGFMASFMQKLMPENLQPREADSDISIRFFGTLSIYINGHYILKNLSRQRQSLLAYLLFHSPRKIHKERLFELFWENSSEESARNSLNVAVHAIRKKIAWALPEVEVLQYEQGCYFINPILKIDTDIEVLNTLFQQGKTLERKGETSAAAKAYYAAHTYYSGQFLENLYDETWTGGERDMFMEKYILILNSLSQYFFQIKEWDTAVQFARLMLKMDNCLEEAHRIIMKCASIQGTIKKVIHQYEICKKSLKEKLDVSPSTTTEKLFNDLRSGK